jgi:SET domain-containing protein
MIETRQSAIHGTGAFASRDISEGERIGTYAGRRYCARQVSRRDWDNALTYVFALSDGSVIDATAEGNATRHLNHSCAPNCIAYEENGSGHKLVIAFYALRAIRAGEELFLDYRLDADHAEERKTFDCACGAIECRGTMLAEPDE